MYVRIAQLLPLRTCLHELDALRYEKRSSISLFPRFCYSPSLLFILVIFQEISNVRSLIKGSENQKIMRFCSILRDRSMRMGRVRLMVTFEGLAIANWQYSDVPKWRTHTSCSRQKKWTLFICFSCLKKV